MQIKTDTRANGGIRVRYRVGKDGPFATIGTFPSRQKADEAIGALRRDAARDELADGRRERMLLNNFAAEQLWKAKLAKGNEPETIRAQKRQWDHYISPYLGGMELRKIDKGEVRSWFYRFLEDENGEWPEIVGVRSLEPLSGSSLWKIYFLAHEAFALAVEVEYLRRSPFPKRPLVATPTTSRATRWLNNHEVARFAGAMQGRDDSVLTYVLAYGGFRISEATALRLDDLDFHNNTIHVDEIVRPNGTLRPYPKNHFSRRTVHMSDAVMELLHSFVDDTYALSDDKQLVFTAPAGGPKRYDNWVTRVFKPAASRAGLLPLTPHHLRHTAATMWIDLGASMLSVARRLGSQGHDDGAARVRPPLSRPRRPPGGCAGPTVRDGRPA